MRIAEIVRIAIERWSKHDIVEFSIRGFPNEVVLQLTVQHLGKHYGCNMAIACLELRAAHDLGHRLAALEALGLEHWLKHGAWLQRPPPDAPRHELGPHAHLLCRQGK